MATVDLRPATEVSDGWSPGATGAANVALCTDDDPDSHDGNTTRVDADAPSTGHTWEVTLDDTPGDFSSTNSVTLKIAVRCNKLKSGDIIRSSLRTGGSQIGGNKDFETQNASYTLQTYTDSAWDSMTQAQLDDLNYRCEIIVGDEMEGAAVTAVEVLLDYAVAAADEDLDAELFIAGAQQPRLTHPRFLGPAEITIDPTTLDAPLRDELQWFQKFSVPVLPRHLFQRAEAIVIDPDTIGDPLDDKIGWFAGLSEPVLPRHLFQRAEAAVIDPTTLDAVLRDELQWLPPLSEPVLPRHLFQRAEAAILDQPVVIEDPVDIVDLVGGQQQPRFDPPKVVGY